MKALFVTTDTADCFNHVAAWDSFNEPCRHVTYSVKGICNDWQVEQAAVEYGPDVIFYIGAQDGRGNPRPDTFRRIRELAPVINLCSDAQDKPWHNTLAHYAKKQCFDLQVSIDGAEGAPVDLSTLTPVDPMPFSGDVERDIRCGFSGSLGRWNARSEIVRALVWFDHVTLRNRTGGAESYQSHASFMKRCRMIVNVSNTGTGLDHHIKGRVLEAGWAGCCLLESEGSPIANWFPEDCFFIYRDPPHAAGMIETLSDEVIDRTAYRLAEEVRANYRPEQIYGKMLDLVGRAEPVAA